MTAATAVAAVIVPLLRLDSKLHTGAQNGMT